MPNQSRFVVRTAFIPALGVYVVVKTSNKTNDTGVCKQVATQVHRRSNAANGQDVEKKHIEYTHASAPLLKFDATLEYKRQVRALYAFGKNCLNEKP